MTTLDNIPRAGNGHDRDDHLTAANPIDQEPYQRLTWQDEETGATGYLVVHTLVCGLATGGLRMRPGCTMHEVEDLARGMATKTATFGLPVGGAKGGIDFDPKDERAFGVLERYCMAMRPLLDAHWVTADDAGVTQDRKSTRLNSSHVAISYAVFCLKKKKKKMQHKITLSQEIST